MARRANPERIFQACRDAMQKDALEDELHAEVCAGIVALADAQRSIARDWIAAWEAAGRP